MTHSLFISDLHLSSDRPETSRAFDEFLATIAVQAEALYILGDLFEYWAGDDDIDDPFNRKIVDALNNLSTGGTALYLMHGNRDFLIGNKMTSACGAQLLADPTLITLHGMPTLLMHGDTLCTDDVGYMEFRAQVRNAEWQAHFLSHPLAERKAQIEKMRGKSRQAQSQKTLEILDANTETIASVLRNNGYPRLIHGHTHRPAHHRHHIDGHDCERWVLDSWYDHGSYLRCDSLGCQSAPL